MKPFCAALIAAIMLLAGTSGGSAQTEKRPPNLSPEARLRVRQAIAAVGLVLARNLGDPADQGPRPRGSAVVVRKDGVVVTNYHVIKQTRSTSMFDELYFVFSADGEAVTSSSIRYRLKPLVVNRDYDLALLRIESETSGKGVPGSTVFPTLEIGDSKSIQLLDDLTIIGFPEKGGLTVTVNRGVVEGKDVLANWIKTDARVIHGNSGGAAVNSEGKLIGIPTRVVADSQPIDKNGDGFPDDYRDYGAVGFLRPAHLVSAMLEQIKSQDMSRLLTQAKPQMATSEPTVTVSGEVRSPAAGKPVAGALVGLLPVGTRNITGSSLLTWGRTNAEGRFELNKPVPSGKYMLRARAIGYDPFTSEVEIGSKGQRLIVELKPSNSR